MIKIVFIASICTLLAACGGGSTPESASEQVTESSESLNQGKADKGKYLIAQSDCLTCHKEQEKLIGPAYLDVAKKYEANDKNVAYLADKIINGGSGVWGEVPMTTHPAISKDDAKEMAHYILSLND